MLSQVAIPRQGCFLFVKVHHKKGWPFSARYTLFLEKNVSKANIKEVGERLLVSLYGGKANNSLDQINPFFFTKDSFE